MTVTVAIHANVRDQALHSSQNNIVVLLDSDSCGNSVLGISLLYLICEGNLLSSASHRHIGLLRSDLLHNPIVGYWNCFVLVGAHTGTELDVISIHPK